MKRKLLSTLLSLCLIATVFSAMPLTASAASIDLSSHFANGTGYELNTNSGDYSVSGSYTSSFLSVVATQGGGTINITCTDFKLTPQSWASCLKIKNTGDDKLTVNLIINGTCSFTGHNWGGIAICGNVVLNFRTTVANSTVTSTSTTEKQAMQAVNREESAIVDDRAVFQIGSNTLMTSCKVNNVAYDTLEEGVSASYAAKPFVLQLSPTTSNEVLLDNRSATTSGTQKIYAIQGQNLPVIQAPTKTGSTFGGYFTETDGNGTQYYTATGEGARTWGLSSDATLYAYWIPEIYTISTAVNPGGSGTVSGGGDFTNGQLVTLTATANNNYYFTGWYDGATIASDKASFSFNATQDKTYTAKFEPVTATFTITADTGYYSDEADGADKAGIIAFNALFNQFASYGDQLTDFGLYIYNTAVADENKKATLNKPGSISDLRAANGFYFGTITEIDSANFASKAVAVPFVVVAGKAYTGNPFIAAVNDYLKWLGEKPLE